MQQQEIIAQAAAGRPDLAAINAVWCLGRLRLAAYVLRKYNHSSGQKLPVREWIYFARSFARAEEARNRR